MIEVGKIELETARSQLVDGVSPFMGTK